MAAEVEPGPLVDQLSPAQDRVLLAINPKAGAGTRLALVDQVADYLISQGFTVCRKTNLDELVQQAKADFQAGRLRAVVGCGGDGTMGALLNRTPVGMPLAVLPLGTENLLAKYVGIQPTAASLGQAIAAGRLMRLDAGRICPLADVSSSGGWSEPTAADGQLFWLMTSCGFDARVIQELHQRRAGHIRHWSYVKPLLRAMRSYDYPALRVYCPAEETADGQPLDWRVRWIYAFNLPCYAAQLPIAPEANGHDGWLDLCGFERGSCWQGWRYLAAVLSGRHARLPDCRIARCRRLRILAEGAAPVQCDGDPANGPPLEIDLLRRRAALLVPPEFGLRGRTGSN